MFALQLVFKDAGSKPEMLYVNQLQLTISGDPSADLVIEDLRKSKETVQIAKGLGRNFKLLRKDSQGEVLNDQLCDFFESFDLGFARLTVIALDADLKPHGYSSFEKAGISALKEAVSPVKQPFPALVLRGKDEAQISLGNLTQIYVGRSSVCDVRLRSPEISGKHCRVGLESDFIWVEDLGSTNGTFFAGRQISGRVNVDYAAPILLGRDLTLSIVRTPSELERAVSNDHLSASVGAEVRYPVICAYSQVARPGRLELAPGSRFTIGRDPASDLWLGAPHVSRQHCEIQCEADGKIIVVDKSTNGTAYSRGVLKSGERLEISKDAEIFNFGNDLTLAICFNAEQESLYRAAKGDFLTFLGTPFASSAPLRAVAGNLEFEESGNEPVGMVADSIENRKPSFGSITKSGFDIKNPRDLMSVGLVVLLVTVVFFAVAGVIISFK